MTTDPMLGVDVLRSGSGLSFGICSAVKVSMIGIDVLDSGVDRSYRSNEVFLRSVGVSFTSLDTGAEVARWMAGTFFCICVLLLLATG